MNEIGKCTIWTLKLTCIILTCALNMALYGGVAAMVLGGLKMVAPNLTPEWQLYIGMPLGIAILLFVATHPATERVGSWLDAKFGRGELWDI